MKLYDTLMSVGYHEPDALPHDPPGRLPSTYLERAEKAVPVLIQNVADYWHEQTNEHRETSAPHMRLPWENAWFEWSRKFSVKGYEGVWRFGLLAWPDYTHLSGGYFDGDTTTLRPDAAEAQIYLAFIWKPQKVTPTCIGTIDAVVSHDGRLLAAGFSDFKSDTWGPLDLEGDALDMHAGGQGPEGLLIFMLGCARLALTFAHCKNVCTRDHHTPPKVAAKRRKAGKPVGTSYKTLVIDPMKEVLRTEGNIEKNGLKKALHICRGHFATYTEDKPLFGKVTGTFWKPMHTRGSAKRGRVEKDYEIKAKTA